MQVGYGVKVKNQAGQMENEKDQSAEQGDESWHEARSGG